MTTLKEVDAFLYTFKELKQKHGLIILDREKNLQALLDMEMDVAQRSAIIMGLQPRDYYRGPRPDQIRKGFDFWEFGKQITSNEKDYILYIKLAIRLETHPVICMSFHPAERDIIFPFGNPQ